MARDIDHIREQLEARVPGITIEQLRPTWPDDDDDDDDGLWFVRLPGRSDELQLESTTGECPFILEADDEPPGTGRTVEEVVAWVLGFAGRETRVPFFRVSSPKQLTAAGWISLIFAISCALAAAIAVGSWAYSLFPDRPARSARQFVALVLSLPAILVSVGSYLAGSWLFERLGIRTTRSVPQDQSPNLPVGGA